MPVVPPPRLRVAELPSPLRRLPALERALGCDQIWIKRDDLTGLEFSGNKVRKLEYIAAAARQAGCDTLVTEGTPQSNHCRATAAVAARLGLHAHLLLRPAPPAGPPQGNHLLDRLFGATLEYWPRPEFDQRRAEIVDATLARLRAAGRTPRWIPMGASEPLGCWGYIRAAAELAEQLEEAGVEECDVVVAVSSAGTFAGLLLGRQLHRLTHWHLTGILVSDDIEIQRRTILDLCRATIEQYSLPASLDESHIQLDDRFIGPGYAVPYAAALDALRLLASREGILLDPVYTAKAFCGLLEGIRDGRFARSRPVAFIHTGGALSNFAWPETLLGPPDAQETA